MARPAERLPIAEDDEMSGPGPTGGEPRHVPVMVS